MLYSLAVVGVAIPWNCAIGSDHVSVTVLFGLADAALRTNDPRGSESLHHPEPLVSQDCSRRLPSQSFDRLPPLRRYADALVRALIRHY